MLNSRAGLLVLLLIVFCANYGETWMEASSHTRSPVSAADYKGAYAVHRLEPEFINFEFHDQIVPRWAMYGYSISYFALFPAFAVAVLAALARRREIAPMRVLCLAVAADYVVSLPCFLLFAVPERWAYPESNAMLLSDLWSSKLILALRPFSALNNCFPSTHVSLTVIVIAICWLFQVRFRNTVTALGATVILSTFVLGIHWLPDIAAGLIVGVLSVAIAWRFTDTSERRELALNY
jgi:membrane-associated phospholipid phosphatase